MTKIQIWASTIPVICLSLFFLAMETGSRVTVGVGPLPHLSVGFQQTPFLPLTGTSSRTRTDQCLRALHPVSRTLLTPILRARVEQQCVRLAGHVERYWPGDARAAIIRAALASMDQTYSESLRHLTRATRQAPHEGWMAQTRLIELLSMPLADLDLESKVNWHNLVLDNATPVVVTDSGADLIAEWYLRRPHVRPALRLAIENASEPDRARILTRIRVNGRV